MPHDLRRHPGRPGRVLRCAGLDRERDRGAELQPGRPGRPGGTPDLPQIPTLFFCIPPNDQLLAYWDTVADRLYKIRHCLNLQGVAQPLPLYAPPINPLQLMGQGAYGPGAIGTAAPFAPVYRFPSTWNARCS